MSDFQHAITTPAMLLACRYVAQYHSLHATSAQLLVKLFLCQVLYNVRRARVQSSRILRLASLTGSDGRDGGGSLSNRRSDTYQKRSATSTNSSRQRHTCTAAVPFHRAPSRQRRSWHNFANGSQTIPAPSPSPKRQVTLQARSHSRSCSMARRNKPKHSWHRQLSSMAQLAHRDQALPLLTHVLTHSF